MDSAWSLDWHHLCSLCGVHVVCADLCGVHVVRVVCAEYMGECKVLQALSDMQH